MSCTGCIVQQQIFLQAVFYEWFSSKNFHRFPHPTQISNQVCCPNVQRVSWELAVLLMTYSIQSQSSKTTQFLELPFVEDVASLKQAFHKLLKYLLLQGPPGLPGPPGEKVSLFAMNMLNAFLGSSFLWEIWCPYVSLLLWMCANYHIYVSIRQTHRYVVLNQK